MMTSAFARIKSHFVNWRQWEANPVVVKELRQAVRSWAVTGMLLLFLVILFCTALIFLITHSFDRYGDQSLGGNIFSAFLFILTGASVLFIPLYVGIRLASERQEANLDLLYVTTLTPARIIRGKFFCGVYMVILFFSACMPFMVFTNLLRGIDLPTIFFILFSLFLRLCFAILAAIFLACLPIGKVLKILIAVFGLIGAFIGAGSLLSVFIMTLGSGVGSTMGTRDFWSDFALTTGLSVLSMVFLYQLSVASITPLSANRALPLRRFLTAVWVLFGVISVWTVVSKGDPRYILPWTFTSYSILALALVVVISNNDDLSLRVLRAIPVNPLKRALAFVFFNGAAGGLVWVALLTAGTFGVTSAVMHYPGRRPMSSDDQFDFQVMGGAALLYEFGYALTAMIFQRRFLASRSPKIAGIIALLLPGVWALVPYIAFFFLNRLTWKTVESIQLGNIFNIFIVKDNSQKMAHLICGAAWVGLMGLLCLRWFIRQVKHFKPADPWAAPSVAVSPTPNPVEPPPAPPPVPTPAT